MFLCSRLAAQIQDSGAGQTDILRIFLIAKDRHRQFGGFGQHLDALVTRTSIFARGQIGVHHRGVAGDHLAIDA